jgi:hypothetical protein
LGIFARSPLYRHPKLASRILLPFCLELWCEDLRGTSDKYGGFVEHLYPVLADRAIFDKHLTSKQSAAVSEFMRQTILEEVDDQLGLGYQGSKARPYQWIGALTTCGVLLPDVDRVWGARWSLDTFGRAALSFRDCLKLLKHQVGRVRGHNTPSHS